jgi:hypothetical protein
LLGRLDARTLLKIWKESDVAVGFPRPTDYVWEQPEREAILEGFKAF